MRSWSVAIGAAALALCPAVSAQPSAVDPRAPAARSPAALSQAGAIPLYGSATPGNDATEVWAGGDGREMLNVRNVTHPTLTPVLPDPGRATGAAVVVVPGGAFMALAMDLEGAQVARAFADRGIAAFILKYRLLPTPIDGPAAGRYMSKRMRDGLDKVNPVPLGNPDATTDALAALALVRDGAAKWGIDPRRVGMIGFSAGAMTTLRTVLDGAPGKRPDFIGYIYGPQDDVAVPGDAPPMFDAITFDDPLFPSDDFAIAAAWRRAHRPVELHAYQKGGHGFGLGRPGTTPALMLDQFFAWLHMNKILPGETPK